MYSTLISKGFRRPMESFESLEMSKKTSEMTILEFDANYKYLWKMMMQIVQFF